MAEQPTTPPGRLNDLLRPEVLSAFDRETFEREGYWVWENVLTDEGRKRWTSSLQKLQRLNDEMVMDTDWSAINSANCGLQNPIRNDITPEARAKYCGGSELIHHFISKELREYMKDHGLVEPGPTLVTRNHESHGVMPEWFPGLYDDFIMDVTTAHPQMMALFSKVLGKRFFYDHILMLNRPAGSEGRRWHAHPYRQGQHEVEDPVGTGQFVTKEFLHQQCVRTLCYPEGATIEDGCEFAVIPGSHLYRIPFKWSTQRPDYDDDMETNWLKGKTHPFTGEPLKILRLSIPPGSMVSFVHHLPHHVGHRKANTDMRWGLLMAYRSPDPTAEPAKWNESAPIYWCNRTEAAGTLSPTAQRLFEGDNPI
ncbi:MAG: hypothetical protein ACI8V2_003880 [Candidatus Latescibacterota bacterium]|jgi:hypothetical protein